jgi:hypothetical protein
MDIQMKINQRTFIRTDVTCSNHILTQFSEGHKYPGLKRGLLTYDRLDIDDDIRIGQYFSPNPTYLFHVQFFYPEALYHTYHVENSKIVSGPDVHKDYVEKIIRKLGDLNIKPRHPQYVEHATQDLSFGMTIVERRENGMDIPEVFSATAYGLVDGRNRGSIGYL